MPLKIRSLPPRTYKDYKTYKKYLREEFHHKCAYCETHEAEDGGSKKFHVDHYLPKNAFPKKICDYNNLFYSCSECNINKSDYWANTWQKFLQEYILNPCDHDFDKHYDRNAEIWIGKTSVAKWNIHKLRLNSVKRVNVRTSRTLFFKKMEELYEAKLKLLNLPTADTTEVKDQIKEIDLIIKCYKFKTCDPLD